MFKTLRKKLKEKSECKLKGHDWDTVRPYSQVCKRPGCKAQRILKEKRFPKVGEPLYTWETYNPKDFKLP